MFYFGAVLWCPPCRASMRDSRCRVLQYVNGSLMVGGVSDIIHIPELGVIAYKEDLILNAMVGFHDLNDLY